MWMRIEGHRAGFMYSVNNRQLVHPLAAAMLIPRTAHHGISCLSACSPHLCILRTHHNNPAEMSAAPACACIAALERGVCLCSNGIGQPVCKGGELLDGELQCGYDVSTVTYAITLGGHLDARMAGDSS